MDAGLDLVGYVGDELHGLPEVVASTFLLDDVLEDLARGEIVETGQDAVGEALIVSKIQIGFRSVVEDVDLPVLVGRHGPGINIEVGIELLNSDLEATVLKQSADGCGGESLSKGGDHSSGDEDVFHAR